MFSEFIDSIDFELLIQNKKIDKSKQAQHVVLHHVMEHAKTNKIKK